MTVPGIPDRASPLARQPAPDLNLRPQRPQVAGATSSAWWVALACLLPASLAAVVFVPWFGGDFVADTYQFLALIDLLGQRGTTLREILASDGYQTTLLPFYRPLAMLSLAADYHAFGLDPLAFRLVNLTIHVAAALLLGRVASLVTGSRGIGLASACLFAVSPLSAEAVYWVSTRGTLLAAAFGGAALLAAVVAAQRRRAGRARWWTPLLLANPCLALALLAQETAVAFVPLLGIATWCLQRERGLAGVGSALLRTAWAWLVLAAYLTWRRVLLGQWLGGYGAGGVDVLAPAFWQGRLEHLLTAISPVHLGSFPVAVKVAYGLLTLAGLAAAVILAARTPRLRAWVAIAVGWVACFTLPSTFLAVDPANLTNGRLLYVQSAGVLSLLACAAASIGRRPLARLAVAGVVGCSAAVLWGNLRPWRAAGELAGSLRTQIERAAVASLGAQLLLADLPFARDGAFVATGAIATPPFVPVGGPPRLAFLEGEGDLLLHWLAGHRDSDASLWRFDPALGELAPQTLVLPRPQVLKAGGSVLAARSRWLDATTLAAEALVSGDVAAAIPVRVLDGAGKLLATGALTPGPPSHVGDVRRARLPLATGWQGTLQGTQQGTLQVELADGERWLTIDSAVLPDQRGRLK